MENMLGKILENNGLVGAISSSLALILLGIYLGKKKMIHHTAASVLSEIVLTVSIPSLCVTAFLQDFSSQTLIEGINLLIWSFVLHIVLMFGAKIFYLRYSSSKRTTMEILTIFGGVTVFGIPIAQALYGNLGVVYASIYCIAYRVFLYSYGYAKMADINITRKNLGTIFLNPVVITTFVSLGFWAFQNYMPQRDIAGMSYSIFRIDKTMFWLYKPLAYLAGLCSPLAWLATGLKLAEVSFKESFTSKDAWYYSLVKIIILPLTVYVLIIAAGKIGVLPLSVLALRIIMIMMATPVASVVIAYSIKYDKEPHMASKCSLLSTLVSIGVLPFIIIFLHSS